MRRIEVLVVEGYGNKEIQERLNMPSHKVESTASHLRVKHGMSQAKPRKSSGAGERKLENNNRAGFLSCLASVSEIRRLHERKVPLTHIAALLHVSYRDVLAAIA